MAAVLYQMEESQWWSPEVLLAQQLRQASALLNHSYQHVPFYRSRLDQAGFRPGEPVTAEIWARLPVLTRAELQSAGEALSSPVLPKGHGHRYQISSSGSTGQMVTVEGTQINQFFWDALTLREHSWHRRDLTAKLAAIRHFDPGKADYPKGSVSRGWGRSSTSFCGSGPSAQLTVISSAEQQAEWLQRVQPDYLLTYPSALRDLLLHCRDQGITFPKLREVRTVSELLPPDTRTLCREVFGVAIVDGYSNHENGHLGLQCPEAEHYHVPAEVVMLEVLNEAGEACGPGEIGRVAVTPLHNFAMPMIRYEVGDLAEVGPPCVCGRGLPVLKRILGRVRNTLIYPDGRRSWPLLTDVSRAGVKGIRQYQVIQRSLEEIEFRLVTDQPLSPEEEDKLRDWLLLPVEHPFAVRFSYAAELPRGPGGKFEIFRSEVAV